MPIYDVLEEPTDSIAPALIVSFQDWVDAGQAGTTAARHIAEGGQVVARFDPDALFDFRSHRPVLDIVDGSPTRFEWPEMKLTRRRFPERDLFVLTGPEPDFKWKGFATSVLDLAVRFGIIEHVSLGAIPSAVPHTSATPVMMTASTKELMTGTASVDGLLRVPAAAVSLVEWTMAKSGIPAVGFWAQVPHYAAPYVAGSIALVRRVETHLTVTIGAGDLEEEDARQRVALQEIIAANPEAQEYVERLEGLVGEEQIPSSDNIGEEVERFLRNRPGEERGPNPFSP
ncbi:MAG TPA: PAC2 family protein [Actinomycetota bacterium]|nr:PAC2 family protein [Actinomycetota bacterium]